MHRLLVALLIVVGAATPARPGAAQLDRGEEVIFYPAYVMAGGTFEHKVSAITRLMEHFPGRGFVLIGDSGEQDPEVYRAIASRFGARVQEIVIRDVVNARVRQPGRLRA